MTREKGFLDGTRASRAVAAIGSVAVISLSLYALVSGLAVKWVQEVGVAIGAVQLAPPVEDVEEDAPLAEPEEEGEASDVDFREDPVEVVAPPPDIVVELPSPPAAEVASDGAASDAGKADVEGPGSGNSSGDGSGTGSSGSGSGGGGVTKPVYVSGNILTKRAIPDDLRADLRVASSTYRFIVQPDGGITACRAMQSAGSPRLDAYVCRLLTDRLRFEPARNVRGDPVAAEYGWRQDWRQ